MTIASLTNKIIYVGDGSTQTYAYPFKALAQSHLTVSVESSGTITVKSNGTDYVVTGAGADATEAGGNIILTGSSTSIPSSNLLIIQRIVPYKQETDLVENDALPVQSVENQFDTFVMQTQQLKENLDRSVIQAITWTGSAVSLPLGSGNAILGWNSAGSALENKAPIDANTLSTGYVYVGQASAYAGAAGSSAAVVVSVQQYTAAPITTPTRVGEISIDALNSKVYFSVAILGSDSWVAVN